ncbi:MAG: VanW family protein [Acidimicrobiia bacterium]
MKDSFLFRIHPLLAAAIVVGAIFVVLLGFYGMTRAFSRGEVMGRVEVSNTALGGLSEEQATGTMVAVEDEHEARTVVFTVDGTPVEVQPPTTGFEIDEEDIVAEAMSVGREGNAIYQFLFWLTNIFSTNQVELTGTIDEDSMSAIFDEWDTEVIGMPASQGAIELSDAELVAVYPRAGSGLDREAATRIILEAMLASAPTNHALPIDSIVPQLTNSDIDAALLEAQALLSGSIRMVYNGSELTFTQEQLTEAFRSDTIAEGSPQIVNYFDSEVIGELLAPVRDEFEAEPVSARFVISGDTISIEPGSKGTRLDADDVALRLFQAGLSSNRTGQLELVEDADPDVTTEELEALGIKHLVSSFTTYHPCCADRVTNIHTIADTVDMAIVRSGQEFSLNKYVGERTEEKGYVPAGTIVAGELEDTVGGGVSQFATTTYNAIFWGGYQDIAHKPHSYYFSRYPEGVEATINWTTPDLVFRNNTNKAIMLDTQYTEDSITVRIFGDNDGRTLKGEQVGGESKVRVAAEGGPNALHVKGEVSERFAQTTPGPPRYYGNPEFGLNQIEETQSARDGWSVTVTRRILRNGTELVSEQEWAVRYSPAFAVFEVHPCKVPGRESTCPTTTTAPPATTTVPTTPPTTAPPPPTTPTT